MKLADRHTLAATILIAGLAAAGCGGKAKPAGTIDDHGDGAGAAAATAPPGATLADDVAALTDAAKRGEKQVDWPQRVTFLGWTADNRVVYRAMLCDPDELGGRGPYCELRVCSVGEHDAADAGPDCDPAASFELYGDVDFDAAATTTAAETAAGKRGPLTAGTPRSLDAVTLSTAGLNLTARLLDQPARTLIEGSPDEDLGVVSATASYVGDTADGHCRAVVGLAKFRSDYEGVKGNVPYPFAAVACGT